MTTTGNTPNDDVVALVFVNGMFGLITAADLVNDPREHQVVVITDTGLFDSALITADNLAAALLSRLLPLQPREGLYLLGDGNGNPAWLPPAVATASAAGALRLADQDEVNAHTAEADGAPLAVTPETLGALLRVSGHTATQMLFAGVALPIATGSAVGLLSAADFTLLHSGIDRRALRRITRLSSADLALADALLLDDASVANGDQLKAATVSEFIEFIGANPAGFWNNAGRVPAANGPARDFVDFNWDASTHIITFIRADGTTKVATIASAGGGGDSGHGGVTPIPTHQVYAAAAAVGHTFTAADFTGGVGTTNGSFTYSGAAGRQDFAIWSARPLTLINPVGRSFLSSNDFSFVAASRFQISDDNGYMYKTANSPDGYINGLWRVA